jgi:hypothetical protein
LVVSNTVTIVVEAPFGVTMSASSYVDTQIPAFSGVGATPNGTVTWVLQTTVGGVPQTVLSGSVTAGSTGNFSGNIGQTVGPQTYTLTAADKATNATSTASFNVTNSPIKTIGLTASATNVPVGGSVSLTGAVQDGAGYPVPAVTVYLFINGSQVSSSQTGSTGNFTFGATFNAPGSYNCDVASTTTNT